MATKTEGEMLIELDESGYECYIWWFPPDDKYTRFEGVESAYAHLQATKRLAALEDFVREIAEIKTRGAMETSLAFDMLAFIDAAKELLAEKDSSDE